MSDLISVLIPVYNVGKYIEETLDSLINQTHKKIEVVIVDDCSTDDSVQKIENYPRGFNCIKLIKNSKNMGIVGAMNEGLKYCSGDYIARIDGDDIAIPDRLEKQLNYLKTHPEVAIVGCATKSITEDGSYISTANVACGINNISRTIHLFPPCCHIWLARKEVYSHLGGYRQVAPAEDYDFLLRAITSGYKVDNISEPLMLIRNRAGNTADLAGLKQRKAHHYVIYLYKKRVLAGVEDDNFNSEDFNSALKSFALEEKLHKVSNKLMKKGISSKNKIIKIVYYSLAVLISYEQMKYIIARANYKFMIWAQK